MVMKRVDGEHEEMKARIEKLEEVLRVLIVELTPGVRLGVAGDMLSKLPLTYPKA